MPPPSPTNSDWRVLAAQQPPNWSGDLDDDCTAIWAGFMLRAEQMDERNWWWCVYEVGSSEQIASSNDGEATPCTTGESARCAAEQAARRLLEL
jgi:hypothetical protein